MIWFCCVCTSLLRRSFAFHYNPLNIIINYKNDNNNNNDVIIVVCDCPCLYETLMSFLFLFNSSKYFSSCTLNNTAHSIYCNEYIMHKISQEVLSICTKVSMEMPSMTKIRKISLNLISMFVLRGLFHAIHYICISFDQSLLLLIHMWTKRGYCFMEGVQTWERHSFSKFDLFLRRKIYKWIQKDDETIIHVHMQKICRLVREWRSIANYYPLQMGL